jgi:hypothetical protein
MEIICSSCHKSYPEDAYDDVNKSGKTITRCIKCRGATMISKDKYYYHKRCEHNKMKFTCETCYPLFYKYIFKERIEWQNYTNSPDLTFHYVKPLYILYGLKVSSFKTSEEINCISDLLSEGKEFVDDPNMRFCVRCRDYKNKETVNQLNFCDECGFSDIILENSDDDVPENYVLCSTCHKHKDPSLFVHKITDQTTKSCIDCRNHREEKSHCKHQIKRTKCAICQTVDMSITFSDVDITEN